MIKVTQGIYNDKTVKEMNKMMNISNSPAGITVHDEPDMTKVAAEISTYRYKKAIQHMILLRSMEEITNDEVKRLISQLQSPDEENWTVAEECIKQKLS